MIRLFYYEWKRLLQNKIFLALLFLTAVFCWLTMGSEMVAGIGGAAPFSGWSTGACFSKILPLLLVMEGFFYQSVVQHKRTTDSPTAPCCPISGSGL